MSGELGDYVNKQQAEQAAVAAEQAAAALRTMPLSIFRTKCQCFDAQIFTFVKLLMQNPKLKWKFTQKNVVLKVAVQQIRCCWHQP